MMYPSSATQICHSSNSLVKIQGNYVSYPYIPGDAVTFKPPLKLSYCLV